MAEALANTQSVAKFWQELRLPDLQQQLDVAGLAIAEQQEAATKNRRALADATREFKRTAPEATHKGVGPLLRSYQEEIDRLTRRAKHGENAFLELYQKLYEAPDPAPALAAAFDTASRVAELELEARKLSTSLQEYQTESTVLKNQDGTIRKLEERVRTLEAALEERNLEVAEIRDQALADADAARAAQVHEREAQLTEMLMEARSSLAAMQKLHHASQNQLFAIQSQSEEEQVGRQHELELATAELERAQERLMALEREKQEMAKAAQAQAQASSVPAGDEQSRGADKAAAGAQSVEDSMRHELHAQREINARLRGEISSLKAELDQSGSMWAARVEGLKSTIQATEQHARAIEEQLAMRPTIQQVEELRQQVRMLHAVSCNSVSEEDGDDGARSPGSTTKQRPSLDASQGANKAPGGFGSLEALLLQKNRHLEHELTMAKLKVVDTRGQLEAVGTQAADLEAQLAERQALISRLEDDLLASRTAQSGDDPSGRPGTPSKLPSSLVGENMDTSMQQQQQQQQQQQWQQQPQEESSMIKVVCNQRDRFRARKMELEAEVSRLKADLSAAQARVSATTADNVALIERLRYVHGFKQRKNAQDVESGEDAERRYGRLYEEGINPFAEFQGQQRERQKSSLHLPDRLMYQFGQLVFGSQGARLGTFVYLCGLHLLVLLLLFRLMHSGSSDIYAAQMHQLEHGRHSLTSALHHEPVPLRMSPSPSPLP